MPIYEWLIMVGPVTLLVAILFTAAGGAKLIGNSGMVQEFAQIGIGQWFRYFTGILEVSGAIGVLIPKFRFRAALQIAAVMAGATVANLFYPAYTLLAGLTAALMALVLSRVAMATGHESGPLVSNSKIIRSTFAWIGGAKLTSNPSMVREFAQIGFGQWLRYCTGILEVSGAVGVLGC